MNVQPRTVEAGRGAEWWGRGWRTFTSSGWTWLGIMVIYIIIIVLIGLVPFVGDIGHSLLTPVFMGGLMAGCHAIDRKEPLRVAHLFEGFQGAYFVPLLIIGAVNIALVFLIAGIAAVGVLGGAMMTDIMRFDPDGDPLSGMGRMIGALGAGGLLFVLLMLALVTVMAMLNWFAPALVVLQGATALDAMKGSFLACWRNMLPFLVYGLIAIAVGVALLFAFGGLALLFGLGAIFGGQNSGWSAMIGLAVVFFGVIVLLALVIGPVVIGSTYAGYKDTLAPDDTAGSFVRPAAG